MPFNLERQRQAILHVCHADTLDEALQRFKQDHMILDDCKFVLASEHGNEPGLATHRDFSAGAAVRSLFATRRVFVLDRNTVAEMQQGKSTFGIDYSISLDTQALSYLLPYLNHNRSRLPKDFEQVFTFIADPKTNIDPTPYRLENLFNLTKKPAEDERIYERLRAYEILRTIDSKILTSGHVRSTLTDVELTKRAQEQMASLYDLLDTPNSMDGVRFNHATMYALLLKMCIIQLSQPRTTSLEKLLAFCEFCDNRLATMFEREIILACHYFQHGQNLGFFGKIMIGGKDALDRLQGMAWDLYHVRWMEKAITFNVSQHARYFFPALLTFDQGLIKVMDLYPLRACAYSISQNEPYPIFDRNLLEQISKDETTRHLIIERFYSDSAIARRKENRDGCTAKLQSIVESLELEFRHIAKI